MRRRYGKSRGNLTGDCSAVTRITASDTQTLIRIGPKRPEIRRLRVVHIPVSTPNAGETVGYEKVAELVQGVATGVSADIDEGMPVEFDGLETTVERILAELDGDDVELEICR